MVFQRHATELFQLAPTERFQLIEEVSQWPRSCPTFINAKKMNYELLGNQLPHIHWHIIPRLVGRSGTIRASLARAARAPSSDGSGASWSHQPSRTAPSPMAV